MLVRIMLVVDYPKEVKKMHSSKFDNYKEIGEGLPTDNYKNFIYDKDTAKNQANDLFE